MDERVRKSRSLWDTEDENQSLSWSGKEHYSTYDGRRNHRFSSSKADKSSLMSKDQAGWPSLEPSEEKDIIIHKGESIYKDGQDKPELRDRSDNKYSYKSISSGFDRCDQRKHSNSPDDGLSRPCRYLEGGRNRSRDRGRSRSQSPSWSRGRDRSGMRMRSRSRSRSRNRNTARTRSRSPFHERRRDSHGWNDRSDSGKSSQTCRDFVAGNCRRGSLCRFLHSDNMDGDSLVNDHAERWRSKPDRGHTMTYSEGPGRQLWNKVSGLDYGEDDSSRSKSRGTICCKDFMRGKCKWGSSCKFSHHVGSGDNNGKVTRNASFDRDREFQHGETRTLCKYFLAGKCNRDNCWFTHDSRTTNNHESRARDDDGHNSLAEKNRWWNGPKWDQEEPELNVAKGTGWGESVTNENTDHAVPIERDNRWGHGSRTGASPEWKEASSENNNYRSTDGGGDVVAMKSMIVENSNDIKEYPVISQGLESQNLGVVSPGSHGSNTPESSSLHLSEATMHAGVTVTSDIQQHPGVLEGNLASALSFDGLGEPKDSSMNTVFPPGQSLNQNVVENLGLNHPFVSNDQKDNSFFPHPSNAQNFDLNGPGQVLCSSLNLQNQIQSHKKEAAKVPEMAPEFGALQSFYNNASNGQAAQVLFTPAAASSMQKFVNEQAEAHPETALNSFTSTGVVSSLEATLHVQLNPSVRSPDHLDPLGNGRDKGRNGNQISCEFPYSFEQKSQMLFEEFSPMSGGNPEFESALPSVSSKVQNHESPKLKQQETLVLEVKDNNINSGIENDKGQEKNQNDNGDEHGKADNVTGNKDDKDIRLFKNALVEFVKDILKPKWKEGRMSREVHKTIVKKAVDKVTSTIQGDHIPKTQDKIDQYLSHSRTKITKLVLAYVERHLKADT